MFIRRSLHTHTHKHTSRSHPRKQDRGHCCTHNREETWYGVSDLRVLCCQGLAHVLGPRCKPILFFFGKAAPKFLFGNLKDPRHENRRKDHPYFPVALQPWVDLLSPAERGDLLEVGRGSRRKTFVPIFGCLSDTWDCAAMAPQVPSAQAGPAGLFREGKPKGKSQNSWDVS